MEPPTTYPAANPITAPVSPADEGQAPGTGAALTAGPDTVSSAYVSNRSSR